MSGISFEKDIDGIRVFLGSYVHSVSKDKPLDIRPNGVIGVENGKVSRTGGAALVQPISLRI